MCGLTGQKQGGSGTLWHSEAIAEGAVRLAMPAAFDATKGTVIVTRGVGHLACGVRNWTEIEMAEARVLLVALYAKTSVDKPLTYCTERIVIEGIHGVVTAKAVTVGVGIKAFPNGCCALGDGIKPRRIACVLEQAIGHIGSTIVGEHSADPRGGNETSEQGIGRSGLVVVRSIATFYGLHEMLEEFFLQRIFYYIKGERQDVAALDVYKVTLAIAHKCGGDGASCLGMKVGAGKVLPALGKGICKTLHIGRTP